MNRLILLLILAWPAFPQAMFFGLNGTVSGGGGAHIISHAVGGTGSGTTTTAPSISSINGSGATLITLGVSYAGSPCTITDSSSNTYTLAKAQSSGAGVSAAIYFKYGPTVTGAMTFTCTGSSTFPMINVITWGGTATSGTADVTGGNGGSSGTSVNAGSTTLSPNHPNEVCVTQLMTGAAEGSTPTISTPFIVEDASLHGSNNVGGVSGYQIQTTATTETPTYSWTNSIANAGAAACFQ